VNRIHKTGCISSLAEEIGRLETKLEDVTLEVKTMTNLRITVADELTYLKAALENIQSTDEVT
jgi:uncharacterized protein with PhoU and TrkA domain